MYIQTHLVKLKSLDRKTNNTNHSYQHQPPHHHGNRCKSTEFQCVSDGACIEGYKKCNDIGECSDYSDELNCIEISNYLNGKNS